jgi:hypothetical protein
VNFEEIEELEKKLCDKIRYEQAGKKTFKNKH